MRFLTLSILGLTLFFGAFHHPAYAQETVKLRMGTHADYARLVFEWPSKPQYSLSKAEDRIMLRFGKAGAPDLAGLNFSGNVKKVDILSSVGEPLQVAVTIQAGARFRDFIVENKVILDVYNSKEAASSSVPAAVTSSAKDDAKKPEIVSPAAAPSEKEKFTIAPAEKAATVPVGKVDSTSVPAPSLLDHTVTLTSTKSFGVASFVRSGYLWLVLDTVDTGIVPVIEGPQKDILGAFTQEKAEGGVAYRLPLPDGLYAYGEGGGLGWKLILAKKPAKTKPAAVRRQDAALAWMMTSMRKQVVVPDPVVGDRIMVFTSTHADQFAGGARSFVELNQLASPIGLAYTPKADDVKAQILPDKIVIGRPGGLTLSGGEIVAEGPGPLHEPKTEPAEENTPTNAKDDLIQTQPDPNKTDKKEDADSEQAPLGDAPEAVVAEESVDLPPLEDLHALATIKPAGNNIYNFPRWEMGGVGALNHNMHLIMLDSAGKENVDRVESIITMAKLNLANNRAPEALGLLRIAEQFVPELDGNTEFRALRGAASALSGKYDVAFTNFNDTDLQKYADVPFWRAYTLAGLEDWKQAIETLPTSFEDLKTYPAQIQVPLALTLAEIALRGGRVPVAENILSLLAPSFQQMPIQHKAALSYLYGEAERQKNNAEKAEEYWKPLFDGKDHLYRAKAGLSLTKLQLDRKQIKPADAIDRLERLRYAWRGDELEALINFRLGQMYLENKDFLKGLTVLRNAASLASVRDLSIEIDQQMKKAFADVFAKDHLNAMTPVEAISFYEEFKDLAPSGEAGDRYVERLAERLVNADLLGRASALLEYQVNNRLKGDKKAEIAIRLAAIRLLDGNPDGALRSLEIAQAALNGVEPSAAAQENGEKKKDDAKTDNKTEDQSGEKISTEPSAPLTTDGEKQRQINLLKARALSMKKKPDEAMAILEKMRLDADVNRLRTDIAWAAGKWEEAGAALNDLIIMEQISPRLPLTDFQTNLILNRAIALNLASDRVALANLRERHNAQMDKTTKGKLFELISRPRRPDMVGSREAIDSMISELSLFQGFLDSYSSMDADKSKQGTAPKAEEKAPVADPVPVDGAKEDAVDASATDNP